MTRQKTPTLIETMDAVVDRHLTEMHVALAVEVVSYDYDKNMVVVQPVLKRKYKNESSAVKLPTISNVPVAFQRMGKGHLRIPVSKGDTGQMIINERSLDGWLASGGIIDPNDTRKHALIDGVFYPGLNPNNNPISSSAAQSSLELKLKNSYFEILDNGKFKITNGTEELFDLVIQLADEVINIAANIQTSTTNTTFGPMKWNDSAGYSAYESAVDAIKTKLTSMKG